LARLCPVERQPLAVHGKEILTEELAHLLEQVAEPPHDLIVPPDGLSGLGDVQYIYHDNRESSDPVTKMKT